MEFLVRRQNICKTVAEKSWPNTRVKCQLKALIFGICNSNWTFITLNLHK